ncbi:hypothetical protein BCR44DRAFT_1436212 [Catenaria anguillulae PL171]|uniref:Uncharacterized protein n=1 Tax=Catenaria anguillulae PL171 TaxID=765915 RepID=A0A1Y2HII8_9FUNG|nr:hypothetical protein BCR44DRAFT_1436212 [Catenaria anguillulae PL171]
MMRQWELDQIRRGGALQTTSGLAAHAARAMHEIAREGDGRLPSLPPIPPLAESLVSLTSTLASLDLAHSADSAAHVAALAAEHDRLVAADAAADSDLHDLSLTQSLTRDLRDHIQDVLEWAADLDGDLSAWEQSLAVDFSADNRDRIIARAMAMLDEVRDDLRDPMAVLAPLNAFKCRDPVGYRRALAHEVVPLVIATHVRCDLLGWDPIGRGDAIEQRMWHVPVTMYGLPSALSAAARGTSGGSGLNPNDPDAGLYRKVVVGYVMPVLEARIKSAGIALALDRAAGARIVDALEEVLYVVDKSDAHFQKLVLAALESCEQTLATAQDSQLDLISAVPNLGSLLVRLDKYAITTTSSISPSVAMSAIAAFAPTTRPNQASLPTDMAARLVRAHAALLQAAAHVLSTGAPTVSVSAHANSARNLVKLVVESCAGVYLRPRVAPTAVASAAPLVAAVGPLVFPAPHPGGVTSTQQALPTAMVARDEPLVASLRAALVALARNEAWPMTSAQVEVVSKWAVDQAGGWAEQPLQLQEVVSGFKGRRTV